MSRQLDLENKLGVSITREITKGESLEKYLAVYEDQKVLLRIYNDAYYSNRFLREGLAMRAVRSSDSIVIPAIIDEWPEYQIRAIEWFNLDSQPPIGAIPSVHRWLCDQDQVLPYTLRDDLTNHLLNVSTIHSAYQSYFSDKVNEILDLVNWDDGDTGLVHGDFHLDNMGVTGDKLVIYDWEYASSGSSFYDKAYFEILHDQSIFSRIPLSWKALATSVVTHWYLQEIHFSPKEAIYWIENLDFYLNNLN